MARPGSCDWMNMTSSGQEEVVHNAEAVCQNMYIKACEVAVVVCRRQSLL